MLNGYIKAPTADTPVEPEALQLLTGLNLPASLALSPLMYKTDATDALILEYLKANDEYEVPYSALVQKSWGKSY